VPKLLAAAEAEGVRVLWVSLSPCLVEHTPIVEYQAVLPLDHYLEELNRPQQQRALKTIAECIRDALLAAVPVGEEERVDGKKQVDDQLTDELTALVEKKQDLPSPSSLLQLRTEPSPVVSFPQGLTPHTFHLQTASIQMGGKGWELREQPLQVQGALEPLGDGVSLPLVSIPAGEFVMGSPAAEPERSDDEGPQHRVVLEGFWMGQSPITQAQWKAVMGSNPSHFSEQPDSPQRPVERVSWYEAMEFCQRLSASRGRRYSLPSEAQWEYACRAGTAMPFHFGATLTPALANYNGNLIYAKSLKGQYREQTTPVGMFPANGWGLQDMHGNVWEWCLDPWHGTYEGAPTDGSPWVQGGDQSLRLLRGGSWSSHPRGCRSADRLGHLPGLRTRLIGFRVCCLPQGPSLNP
jgi:formylglycine-generating enzyme required for sulfatase activity